MVTSTAGASYFMMEPPLDRETAALSLPELLREDFRTHGGAWISPTLHALVVYRIGHWALSQPQPIRRLISAPIKLLNRLVILNIYGTDIWPDAILGRRIKLGHHQSVHIPSFCVIGDDTMLRHNLTIGYSRPDSPRESVPTIGRRVEIGAGATIIGPITIGDDVIIGPHALVTSDVPAGATVFSPPARILKKPPQPDVAAPESTVENGA